MCSTKNEKTIVFSSSLDNWREANSSFDVGELRIAYHGENHNKSYISKEAFEDAIPTMYNCPIVCNYMRESDSIGGHDVEFVKTDSAVKMVNVTQPVGIVPESAEYSWKEITEPNGETHEYLCVDTLFWKRQEAYSHIKDNGITDESMEISIKSGSTRDDGLYHIDKFEFLAFCLLERDNPCFESACVEMFSENKFREQYMEMIADFKREFNTVSSSNEEAIFAKGGNENMEISELLAKFGLTEENIADVNLEGLSSEEIEQKFAEIKNSLSGEPAQEDDNKNEEFAEDPREENVDEQGEENKPEDEEKKFSLTTDQFVKELCDCLRPVMYDDPTWGRCRRYGYCDSDMAANEVYVYDYQDWNIYGFKYTVNGDSVSIDFSTKTRKRISYVDFDNGTAEFSLKEMLSPMEEAFNAKLDATNKEIEELGKYKADREYEDNKSRVETLFSSFSDLEGDERFETLKNEVSEGKYAMKSEDIEDKCFAIRGRNMTAKFSANTQTQPIRIPAKNTTEVSDEPYGGIFTKYGFGK